MTVISSHSTALAALCRKPSQPALDPFLHSSFSPALDAFPSPFLLPTWYVYPLPYNSIRGLTPNHLFTSRANRARIIAALRSGIGVKRSAPQARSSPLLPSLSQFATQSYTPIVLRTGATTPSVWYNLPMLLVPQSGSHIVEQTSTRRPPKLEMAQKDVVMATGSASC